MAKMRILDRYIFREIASHSLVGLVVFSFVIYVRPLGHVLEVLARHNLTAADTLTLFLLPLPGIMVLTIPMAVLIGTLIGLSRMSIDQEITAIRGSGIGRGQFIRPVLAFAFAGWLLASWMSLSVAPWAARRLSGMEASLSASQVAYEIRPRIFIERFPNLLLYIQNITGSDAEWHGVFIAETGKSGLTRVTLAERGRLVNHPASNQLTLHLDQGTIHEFDAAHPAQSTAISFTETDVPIQYSSGPVTVRKTPATTRTGELWHDASVKSPHQQEDLIELNYRFALPIAALVLALVGIPLGLMPRKGGKSYGLMLSIGLVFSYYILMASGFSLAKQGRINPAIGIWFADFAFFAAGILLLANPRILVKAFNKVKVTLDMLWTRLSSRLQRSQAQAARNLSRQRAAKHGRILRILDFYVIRSWCFYLVILVAAFAGIYMVFDFFQLLGDIVRTHATIGTVIDYYFFLLPQVVYLMLPLSILVATLVTLSLLTKWNELTSMKACGISIYRVAVPLLVAGGLLSVAMFALGNNYLPQTNQRQDALRNQMKGKPAQTLYQPGRQWIMGKDNRIYYYRFFDPDQNTFAGLSAFEISRNNFTLKKRIYAARAFWEPHLKRWVLENGWSRDFQQGRTTYELFAVATFKELTERPDYFKKEVKPSEQMSVFELRRYIRAMRQSGFDVVRLTISLYHKFSYPLIAFVVILIAIPFGASMGKRGALAGIALSIGIGILFWSISALFESMGNLSQLPPAVAAWSPDVIFSLASVYLLLKMRT